MNQICSLISISLWALIIAKARASFNISNILDLDNIKSKYS
jgi:hypothetical protein